MRQRDERAPESAEKTICRATGVTFPPRRRTASATGLADCARTVESLLKTKETSRELGVDLQGAYLLPPSNFKSRKNTCF